MVNLVIVFVCRVGRCQNVLKLFANYQQICEVLKDKPSSAAATGAAGNKRKGRPGKEVPSAGKDLSATAKVLGGMFSIRFLSAALTALYRYDETVRLSLVKLYAIIWSRR